MVASQGCTTMMSSISLLCCCFVFLTAYLSLAYENPRGQHCGETIYNATTDSTFSSDLDVALTTLRNTTASTGFATTYGGDNSSTVTALALCRATVNQSVCQLCIDAAASGIRSVCPNKTAGQVWYTLCMLRYSSDDFLDQADYTVAFELYDTRHAPDPDAYDAKVKLFLRNLSYTAGASEKRYAVGRTAAPQNLTLYGYLDCTRDVDSDSCTGCLLAATSAINSCCLGQWAVWIATPTCNIQFNMDPVHDDWLSNPPYVNIVTPLAGPPSIEAVMGPRDYGAKDGLAIKILIPAISVVGTVALAAMVLGFAMKRRKRQKTQKEGSGLEEDDGDQETMGRRNFVYDLDVLVAATDNFCLVYRLGAGGFGTVYKGKTEKGEEIAVKKLKPGSTQGREEFANEVSLLLKLQHRNLVRLLGCCVEGENRMLVYEYLHNKSLDYLMRMT